MASLLNDPELEALLDHLPIESDAEIEETDAYFARRNEKGRSTRTTSVTRICIDSSSTKWLPSTGTRQNSATCSAVL